ncbi:unnamed protein product [Cuscuta campestris]|uniref:Gag-pol polyprotein n=1 Tax=Cuscuta campestris TaxID=132261 RepID=A0A484LWM0_9ASTE|nr:unnamed protein product [Cuscuta campestris]
MRAFLKSQGGGVWRTVETGGTEPVKYSEDLNTSTIKKFEDYSRTEVLAAEHNDKALNAIFGAVDATQYRLISNCISAKEAWDILEVTHEERFDMDVKAISQSHDAKKMTLDALMGNLETIELNMKEDSKRRKPEKQIAFLGTELEGDGEDALSFDEEFQEQLSLFTKQFKKKWIQKKGKNPNDLMEQHIDLQEKWIELLMVNRRNIAEKNQLIFDLKALKLNLEKAETDNVDLKFKLQKFKDYIKWMKIVGAEVLDVQDLMFKAPGERQGIGCDINTKTNDPPRKDSMNIDKNTRSNHHPAVEPIRKYSVKRHRRNSWTYQYYRCYY